MKEIAELTDIHTWRHVPGYLNPADLPSRGCTAKELISSRWWEGPNWLTAASSEWPKEEYVTDQEAVEAEISKGSQKRSEESAELSLADVSSDTACTALIQENDRITEILHKFSHYNKIVRITAWIKRFVNNIRVAKDLRMKCELTACEYSVAENLVLKKSQKESFTGESDKRLKGLNVFLDEQQLLRTKKLISNRTDKFEFKYPIILEPSHDVIKSLITYTHKRLNHAGISTTMSCLREHVWIIRSRKAVRSIIQKCVTCRRFAGKSLEAAPASLPHNRVRDAAVFEMTGIDFAGPLYLRDGRKSWVCLFTCAVFRAVHLELVTTLSTEGFIEALRRFVARRGRPTTIYSDNGTNFTGASNILRSIDWDKIQAFSSVKKIQWLFNPPSAPWWGGWWERLIRIMKDLLKRTLGKASLNYEEMCTVLCECESIVNARPLTYLSDDQELEAISPEMFLKEIQQDGLPELDWAEKTSLSKRLKYRQKLRIQLKQRFRSEYLGQLSRYNKSKRYNLTIKEGDVVLVINDNQTRLTWPLAKVMQVIPGNDGIARIARVKTATGELVRPFQKLVVLESPPAIRESDDITTSGPLQSEMGDAQQNNDVINGCIQGEDADSQTTENRTKDLSERWKALPEKPEEEGITLEKTTSPSDNTMAVPDELAADHTRRMKTRSGRSIKIPTKYRDYVNVFE